MRTVRKRKVLPDRPFALFWRRYKFADHILNFFFDQRILCRLKQISLIPHFTLPRLVLRSNPTARSPDKSIYLDFP